MNQTFPRLALLLPLLLAPSCSDSGSAGTAVVATPSPVVSALGALLGAPAGPSGAYAELLEALAVDLEAGTGDPVDALLLQGQLFEALSSEADYDALQAVA